MQLLGLVFLFASFFNFLSFLDVPLKDFFIYIGYRRP